MNESGQHVKYDGVSGLGPGAQSGYSFVRDQAQAVSEEYVHGQTLDEPPQPKRVAIVI